MTEETIIGKITTKDIFIVAGFFLEWFIFYISGYLRTSSLSLSIVVSIIGIPWAIYVGKLIRDNAIDNYKLTTGGNINGVQTEEESNSSS